MSFRQIEANRRNALNSVGPGTAVGKNRSRRNAVRHGLSAEIVITAIEDIGDYRAFEVAVIADYDAKTALSNGNWCCDWHRCFGMAASVRLAIETALLNIQASMVRDGCGHPQSMTGGPLFKVENFCRSASSGKCARLTMRRSSSTGNV